MLTLTLNEFENKACENKIKELIAKIEKLNSEGNKLKQNMILKQEQLKSGLDQAISENKLLKTKLETLETNEKNLQSSLASVF